MPHTGKASVLLIEPTLMEAEQIRRALADHGHARVSHHSDPKGVAGLVTAGGPMVIVTELNAGSLELIRRIRAMPEGVSVHVIVLTADSGTERSREAFAAGADDFVAKPFRSDDLVARVRAGERTVCKAHDLHVLAREIEQAFRAIDPTAATSAFERATAILKAGTTGPKGAADEAIEALPWDEMGSALRSSLSDFYQLPFEIGTVRNDNAASIVADVRMAETTRKLAVGIAFVVSSPSAKCLAGHVLGDETDVETACGLVLEGANVLMGALKTAYVDRGYEITGGLPSSSDAGQTRAIFDEQPTRQRFAFVAGPDVNVEVWVRIAEKQNVSIRARDLREGMVVAEDVRDARGMLLIRAGARLTETAAERIAKLAPDLCVSVAD